jgi:hypothetical protein
MPALCLLGRMYALEKGFGMRDKADNATIVVLSQLLNKQEQVRHPTHDIVAVHRSDSARRDGLNQLVQRNDCELQEWLCRRKRS